MTFAALQTLTSRAFPLLSSHAGIQVINFSVSGTDTTWWVRDMKDMLRRWVADNRRPMGVILSLSLANEGMLVPSFERSAVKTFRDNLLAILEICRHLSFSLSNRLLSDFRSQSRASPCHTRVCVPQRSILRKTLRFIARNTRVDDQHTPARHRLPLRLCLSLSLLLQVSSFPL